MIQVFARLLPCNFEKKKNNGKFCKVSFCFSYYPNPSIEGSKGKSDFHKETEHQYREFIHFVEVQSCAIHDKAIIILLQIFIVFEVDLSLVSLIYSSIDQWIFLFSLLWMQAYAIPCLCFMVKFCVAKLAYHKMQQLSYSFLWPNHIELIRATGYLSQQYI